MRRIGILMLLFFCCVSTAWLWAQPQPNLKITSFDVVGAANGTYPYYINTLGAIIGWYTDAGNTNHGFLRASDGKITTFDGAPGALGTQAYGMNTQGVITGQWRDVNSVHHGFVRTPDGKIRTFDDPGAGTEAGQGTFGYNINDAGTITGIYKDGGSLPHVFLLAPDGKFTTFDVPGAVGGTIMPTGYGLNLLGEITGSYVTLDGVYHGFVRYPDGKYTTFDAPNAGTNGALEEGTLAFSLNPEGEVVGLYWDEANFLHSFIRDPQGHISTFDLPGGLEGGGTWISSNNLAGAINGFYYDVNYNGHGFLGVPNNITYFDVPGDYYGTYPYGNNWAGEVMGSWYDVNGLSHGFVVIPEVRRGSGSKQ